MFESVSNCRCRLLQIGFFVLLQINQRASFLKSWVIGPICGTIILVHAFVCFSFKILEASCHSMVSFVGKVQWYVRKVRSFLQDFARFREMLPNNRKIILSLVSTYQSQRRKLFHKLSKLRINFCCTFAFPSFYNLLQPILLMCFKSYTMTCCNYFMKFDTSLFILKPSTNLNGVLLRKGNKPVTIEDRPFLFNLITSRLEVEQKESSTTSEWSCPFAFDNGVK